MSPRGRVNVGRAMSRAQAIASLVFGSIVTFIALLIVAALVAGHHRGADVVVVLVFGAAFGGIPITTSIIKLRQLARPPSLPTDVSQFTSADQLDVRSSLDRASLNPGEQMLGWFGPILMVGLKYGATGEVVLEHEIERNPFNTVIFTDRQILGLMLAPDDLQQIEGATGLKRVTAFIDQSPELTMDKNQQFCALNRNRWGDLIAVATGSGLDVAIQHHVNFGLPYASIQSFHAKTGLFMRWIKLTLKDGHVVRLSTIQGNGPVNAAAQMLERFVAKA